MQNRRISYKRIFGAALLLILAIFLFDSLRRSAAKRGNNSSQNNLIVSTEDQPAETTISEDLSDEELPEDDSYQKAEIDEKQFKKLTKSKGEMGVGELVLINKDYSYKFQDISSVLVKVVSNMQDRTYKLSYNTHEVQKAMMEPFNNMMKDFYQLYNSKDVTIVSSHIPYSDQNNLYKAPANPEILASDNEMAAGYTEHHSGYAVDFKLVSDSGNISLFDGTGNYSWINENCYKYGFIQRYPEGKENVTGVKANPAHFRYVGVPHSYIMHDNGFTLEEYLNDLKKYTFGYDKLEYSVFGYNYEIYYVPVEGESTIVPVPVGESYSVSGNNYDGFVVTVCKPSEEISSESSVTTAVTTAAVTQ